MSEQQSVLANCCDAARFSATYSTPVSFPQLRLHKRGERGSSFGRSLAGIDFVPRRAINATRFVPYLDSGETICALAYQSLALLDRFRVRSSRQNLDAFDMAFFHEVAAHARLLYLWRERAHSLLARRQALSLSRQMPGFHYDERYTAPDPQQSEVCASPP
jgi:hypothetical protein